MTQSKEYMIYCSIVSEQLEWQTVYNTLSRTQMQKRYFVICWIYRLHSTCTYNTPVLKYINECGLWITSPNKKEVIYIVLIKMDLKYTRKKQNVWKIIDIYCIYIYICVY